MIQYKLVRLSPAFLRWIRLHVLVDFKRLSRYLPDRGKLLDVGCGIGLLDFKMASKNPRLSIFAIDIKQESIDLALQFNALPNIQYSCTPLSAVDGLFDCILLVDVIHHVRPSDYNDLISCCALGFYLAAIWS